ncbi:MAG: protein kinase [Myxococcales bacterium]
MRVGLVLNGRYRITQQLGEGGMGLVYRGERLELGRPVAIKFLHSPYAHSSRFVQRFQREARAMSKLSHPYCVSVLDFGVHDRAPYIVMDFVTGRTLREVMDEGRLHARRALDITRQLLAGLSHAHGQGVIHRDIKPGNIMLGEATGLGDHVRIFDFGLAKLHDPELDGEPSMAAIVGTPAYMAPEQTRAEKVDARVDLYAAGVVLFEMLTGQKPFQGGEAYEILMMQRDQMPPRLRELAPELSWELEALVARALEKEPEKRFQTASDFVVAIESTPEWRLSGPAAAQAKLETAETLATAPASDRSQSRSATMSVSGLQTGSGAGLQAPVAPVPVKPRKPRSLMRGTVMLLLLLAAVIWWRSQPRTEAVAAGPQTPEEQPPAALGRTEAPPTPALAASPGTSKPDPQEEPSAPVQAPAPSTPNENEGAAEAVPAGDGDEMDFSDAALAAADEALNETEEREVTLPAEPGEPKVSSLGEVKALVAKGKVDAAIRGIQQLRRQTPHNPMLPLMLGNLYIDKNWWSDGLAKYREAIKLSSGIKKNPRVQRDAIKALGVDKVYARARTLLVRDIGRSAVSALKRAASHDPSKDVRKRASSVLKQITR